MNGRLIVIRAKAFQVEVAYTWVISANAVKKGSLCKNLSNEHREGGQCMMGRWMKGRQRQIIWTLIIAIGIGLATRLPRSGAVAVIIYLTWDFMWVWIPNRYRSFAAALAFVGLSLLGLVWFSFHPPFRGLIPLLLLPNAAVLGARASPYRSSWLALAGLVAALVVLDPTRPSNILGALISLIGTYVGSYGFELRRQARELDRRRLAELEIAYQKLHEAHRELTARTREVIAARAREARLEIAADIHDHVGHRLTSLIVGLESLKWMVDAPPDTRAHLERLLETARDALNSVRRAVHARGQSRTPLTSADFRDLVQETGTVSQLTIQFHGSEWLNSCSLTVRQTLFHVLQESLTNILRHAEAQRVVVDLAAAEGAICLRVMDDGMLERLPTPGFGLRELQHRCHALGGTLSLNIRPPHGLVVEATLPLTDLQEEQA